MHIIIELTHIDYERENENCILLSGLTCQSEKKKENKHMRNKTMYSNAHIGENIKFKEVRTNDNITFTK